MNRKREPQKRIPRAKKDESVICRYDDSGLTQDHIFAHKVVLGEGCYQLRNVNPRWNEQ